MSPIGAASRLLILVLTSTLLLATFETSIAGSDAAARTVPVIAVTHAPAVAGFALADASVTQSPPATSAPHSAAGLLAHGLRSGNEVALTFDADMTPFMLHQLQTGLVQSWYDARIEQILDQQNVPAAIFFTGLWAKAYPAVARRLANDPLIEVGNHTYDHAAFSLPCYRLPRAEDKKAEIRLAQQIIQRVTGVVPKLFRFPGDCYGKSDALLVQQMGLAVVSGDVKGADAFNPRPASVVSIVLSRLQAGSIVILHLQGGPNAPATSAALARIIASARARGLRFVKVSTLLAELMQPSQVRISKRIWSGWTRMRSTSYPPSASPRRTRRPASRRA